CSYCSLFVVWFVFFFQAEDGIRDKLVTGVQTCALPISSGCARSAPGAARSSGRSALRTRTAVPLGAGRSGGWPRRRTGSRGRWRSEERRVGKECRSGG